MRNGAIIRRLAYSGVIGTLVEPSPLDGDVQGLEV